MFITLPNFTSLLTSVLLINRLYRGQCYCSQIFFYVQMSTVMESANFWPKMTKTWCLKHLKISKSIFGSEWAVESVRGQKQKFHLQVKNTCFNNSKTSNDNNSKKKFVDCVECKSNALLLKSLDTLQDFYHFLL